MGKENLKIKINLTNKETKERILELERVLKIDLSKFEGKKFNKRFTDFINWKKGEREEIYCFFNTKSQNVGNFYIQGESSRSMSINMADFLDEGERINILKFKEKIKRIKESKEASIKESIKALETLDEDLKKWLKLKEEFDSLTSSLHYAVRDFTHNDWTYKIRG